jgi:hypothetical protein
MTTIEVIDTVIKIGLGALITAFVTLIVTRSTQTPELRKERLRRKQDLLERIVEQFEAVHSDLVEAGILCGSWERIDPNVRDKLQLQNKWGPIYRRITEGVKCLEPIEGKLLWAGLPNSAATLCAYRREITEFLGTISPERSLDERIIKKKLMECCKVRLELHGRLTNEYNGFNEQKVPKAYEWEEQNASDSDH